jgi:hypothetical protein
MISFYFKNNTCDNKNYIKKMDVLVR